MAFNYGNSIVDMFHAINDLAQSYANDFDYESNIESMFAQFIDDSNGMIRVLEHDDHTLFNYAIDEMIRIITDDIDGDDDIDDVLSAINTLRHITT